MSDVGVFEERLVFGLDIGTRNVVGTVGYKKENEFIVVAQYVMEHETRAMLDGQIHDIKRVGRTITKVKEALEEQIGQPLKEVCIAAAGRVLKTVTTNIAYDFPEETVVDGEAIHTLDLLGIEKAQSLLKELNDTKYKFYCVGYSVVKYYLNDEPFTSLEAHKAERISEDIIVTFLPEDVVDGLYAAVGIAGLTVANMTLEPIAAINVAIPENFRLLNIALVDIGAGTSDISVTKDGSIIAYGMIPLAGDELTETIVQHYLVDFNTAEHIKLACGSSKEITYRDIMLIEHTIPAEEVWELTEPVVDKMTTAVADKIKELNGDKAVSATFIVGGGGKIHGYTEMLAEKLGIAPERVALRGEEVLQEVTFRQPEIKKDPLLVTPIGICLNYYDQRNSFIMVRFNGEHIKLYDNNKLTIVDAALQAGFPNEDLFPKRGTPLQFMVNGVTRIMRGEPGESAAIYMNDRLVNINTPLEPNSDIYIEPSTAGAPASCRLEQLEENGASTMVFVVNSRIVRCPRFLEVNGSIELPSYEIKEGDDVETRSFYTVGQLAEFMDVEVDMDREILVNNRVSTMESLIYENFTIDWTVLSYGAAAIDPSTLEVADLSALKGRSTLQAEKPETETAENVVSTASEEAVASETSAASEAAAPSAESAASIASEGAEPSAANIVSEPSAANVGAVSNTASETSIAGETVAESVASETSAVSEAVAESVASETSAVSEAAAPSAESAASIASAGAVPSVASAASIASEAVVAQSVASAASIAGEAVAASTASAVSETSVASAANVASEGAVPSAESVVSETSAANVASEGAVPNTASGTSVAGEAVAASTASAGAAPSAESAANVASEGAVPNIESTVNVASEAGAVPSTASETSVAGEAVAASTESAANAASEVSAAPNTESAASITSAGAAPSAESAANVASEAGAVPSTASETSVAGEAVAAKTASVGAAPSAENAANVASEASAPSAENIQPAAGQNAVDELLVYINGEPVQLKGKKQYIFVDIFDFYKFDLSASAGRAVITNLNGQKAQFTAVLNEQDRIELGWSEN